MCLDRREKHPPKVLITDFIKSVQKTWSVTKQTITVLSPWEKGEERIPVARSLVAFDKKGNTGLLINSAVEEGWAGCCQM